MHKGQWLQGDQHRRLNRVATEREVGKVKRKFKWQRSLGEGGDERAGKEESGECWEGIELS